jgi:flavin reductase (DIM6/NTAB) family NADH-FMN oxidoreductase RutF
VAASGEDHSCSAAEQSAGDHRIVVGRVDDTRVTPADEPLVFFSGGFGTVR